MRPPPLEALTRAAYHDGEKRVTRDVPRCQWWLGDRQCRAPARRDDPMLRCGAHQERRRRGLLPTPDPVMDPAPPPAVDPVAPADDPVAGVPPVVIDAATEAVYAHARALHRLAEALDRVALALTRAGGETGH